MPRDRRRDLVTFYAFCRTIDDIADDPERTPTRKQEELAAWKSALTDSRRPPGALEAEVRDLRARHRLAPDLFLEIIRGCESDISPQRFETMEDLRQYTYRVAGAVGLLSLPLFGASPDSRHYAVTLGHALQLTNILRDVGEDLSNDTRIYLPLADLARFQYSPDDLMAHTHDDRFLALMNFEAARAENLLTEAANSLPAADRRALRPAEIMRAIYFRLLDQMRRDRFRVFDRRYRLSPWRKFAILAQKSIC